MIDRESQAKKSRLELRRLISTGNLDQNKVFAQVDEAARAGSESKKQRLGLMLRVREMLTQEQRKRLDELAREGHHGPPGQLPAGPRSPLRR